MLQQSRVELPGEWVATSRTLIEKGTGSEASAIKLLERAVEADPYNYSAWTLLAFAQTRLAGRLNAEATQSLLRSIELCAYCEESLLRWRLTFVLNHWEDASERLRIGVFSGADFLRWWHLDGEFLSQMREFAKQREIPYDEYRRKIDTPVRPHEIGR